MGRVVTADQIHLLRKSFDLVERQSHVAALIFYRRLFQLDPSLRRIFTTDIEEQARKLMDMLGIVLSLLERPGAVESELEESGLRHAGYGVRDEHYSTVGTALLDMLAEVLAANWTPSVQLAWTEFYGYLTQAMQRGAARAAFHPRKNQQGSQESSSIPGGNR